MVLILQAAVNVAEGHKQRVILESEGAVSLSQGKKSPTDGSIARSEIE